MEQPEDGKHDLRAAEHDEPPRWAVSVTTNMQAAPTSGGSPILRTTKLDDGRTEHVFALTPWPEAGTISVQWEMPSVDGEQTIKWTLSCDPPLNHAVIVAMLRDLVAQDERVVLDSAPDPEFDAFQDMGRRFVEKRRRERDEPRENGE